MADTAAHLVDHVLPLVADTRFNDGHGAGTAES
jgi:hypothetical protein